MYNKYNLVLDENRSNELLEEVLLYHYYYLNKILQTNTDKETLKKCQNIGVKCLGLANNTPYEFVYFI